LQAAIFDVDGTLVDSNAAHAQAWRDALAEAGYRVPLDRLRPLIGMGGDKLLRAAIGLDASSVRGAAIITRRGDIFCDRYLAPVKAFEGTRELLESLKARGFRLGVASAAAEEELMPLLRAAGADDLIENRTSGDDAPRSKPDPDIVTVALQRLGVSPHQAVMIGDTPYDVEAARLAGLGCIGFRCGGWDDRGLAGALAVYDGPLDLLRSLDLSPLGKTAA
jgi:HAD superfamily hydrolase (TIGR01509 family)